MFISSMDFGFRILMRIHSLQENHPEEPTCSTSLVKKEEEGTKIAYSLKPSTCSSIIILFCFYSNRDSKHCEMRTIQDREVSSFLEENRNELEAEIHEVECNSLQGDCMGEESEDECTSIFFMGDFHITAKDVGPCEGGETYFGSY